MSHCVVKLHNAKFCNMYLTMLPNLVCSWLQFRCNKNCAELHYEFMHLYPKRAVHKPYNGCLKYLSLITTHACIISQLARICQLLFYVKFWPSLTKLNQLHYNIQYILIRKSVLMQVDSNYTTKWSYTMLTDCLGIDELCLL